MTFSLRTILLIALVIVLLAGGYGELRYRNGWYDHSDHINALAADKRTKAEKAIQPVEQKAAQASEESKIIYRTITRNVVKYVQDPNRTVCVFDESLSGCGNALSTLPTPSADLMQPPSKASDAGKYSDEDLQADVETAECLRQLRLDKYRWQAWYKAVI